MIDKDWKQSTKKKDFQNGIWNNSLIKGKGQLSEFVRDAINRFDEDEEALNKRQQNKNKMRTQRDGNNSSKFPFLWRNGSHG